jgi:hypothetical protein
VWGKNLIVSMLVRLYKSAAFIKNLAIVFAGAVLWLPRFYASLETSTAEQYPLFNCCFGVFQQSPSYISMGIALLLLLLGAFFTQHALNFDRLRISGHNFPLLLFVVLSATPHVAFFSPVVLTALMLAAALLFTFRIPETPDNDHLIFFAACFFGTATLFYPPALFLMALFVAIYFSGHLSSKKIGVAILGFLFPVIWMVGGLYLASNLSPLLEQWAHPFVLVSLPELVSDMRSFVILSFVVMIYVVIIFRILSTFSERTAIIRRRITMSCYMTLLLFLGVFFSCDFYEHLMLLSVPMVALVSYYYNEDAETPWVDYALLGCFVALAVYSFLQL